MTSVELIRQLCRERGISVAKLERDCGFSNGYIRNMANGIFPSDKALKIATYLEIPVEKLNRKLTRLKELYLAEGITLEEYKHDKEEITSQIASLTAKISPVRPDVSRLKDFLATDIESLYGGFNPDEKRFFWRSIIQEIRFDIDRNIDVLFLP